MRLPLLLLALALPSLLSAQSLDHSKELNERRMALTTAFAKAQSQLRGKETADKMAGEAGLTELAAKVTALRDDVVQANEALIKGFNEQPYFYGDRDPSATIKGSLAKMQADNSALDALTPLPSVAPFSPQDINKLQVALDRLKKAIEEHAKAGANYNTTLTQRKRKPVESPDKALGTSSRGTPQQVPTTTTSSKRKR